MIPLSDLQTRQNGFGALDSSKLGRMSLPEYEEASARRTMPDERPDLFSTTCLESFNLNQLSMLISLLVSRQ